MDMKLELIVIPVSDVDRAKDFYANRTQFHLDVDYQAGDFRVVQLSPPGSACSVALMRNPEAAGTLRGLHLIVADIQATRAFLLEQGVEPSEIFHFDKGQQMPGPDPQRASYGSFLEFKDPDGTGWLVQEVHRSEPAAK